MWLGTLAFLYPLLANKQIMKQQSNEPPAHPTKELILRSWLIWSRESFFSSRERWCGWRWWETGRVAQTCTSSFLFFGWPQLRSGTVVQWAQWESCTCTVAQSGTVASTCTISFSLVFMDAPPSLIPIISDCTFSMLSQDPGFENKS